MRHLSNYIALSLLAAAFAGCSSTDTGSNSPSSTGGQDPLTGPLAVYEGSIKPLAGAITFVSGSGLVSVTVGSGELVILSKRAVDSALLINGVPCPADGTTHVAATTTSIKTITLTGGGGAETVLIDVRNGKFAPASATGGGIQINLGGGDNVAVLGSTAGDKMGCARTTATPTLTARDAIGLTSATSKDVTIQPTGVNTITIDLNDGDDSFDQGNCQTAMTVYGGKGKDTIIATAEPAQGDPAPKNDTFSGGADPDTLSYANRTTAVVVNLTASPASGMAAGKAGVAGVEADSITDDFETITTGSGNDTIYSGSALSAYILNGGVGADKFVTQTTHGATINGGTGTDTIDYSTRATKVTVDMGDSKATDGEAGDTDNVAKDVENIIGTGLGDKLTGNALNNVFSFATQTTPGNDTINGGDGDDTFMADSAADGNDVFNGGNGSDTVDYSARATGVCVNLNNTATSGSCTAVISVTTTVAPTWPSVGSGESDTIGLDVENAVGTAGNDHIVGNTSANVILGLGGTDKLEGDLGTDTIDANSYTTTLGNGNTCNPVTLACYGIVHTACDCATAALSSACPHTVGAVVNTNSAIVCGGQPLDVASCSSGVAGQFTGCTLQQTN